MLAGLNILNSSENHCHILKDEQKLVLTMQLSVNYIQLLVLPVIDLGPEGLLNAASAAVQCYKVVNCFQISSNIHFQQ